jgi:hypothetical protein
MKNKNIKNKKFIKINKLFTFKKGVGVNFDIGCGPVVLVTMELNTLTIGEDKMNNNTLTKKEDKMNNSNQTNFDFDSFRNDINNNEKEDKTMPDNTNDEVFDPDYYVLVTDFDSAKKKIEEMLKCYAGIDVLAEIILYNTATYRKFFWDHTWAPDYECWNCRSRHLEKYGNDCEGETCSLCPYFSFIPKGFDKFKSCEDLDGHLYTKELVNMFIKSDPSYFED